MVPFPGAADHLLGQPKFLISNERIMQIAHKLAGRVHGGVLITVCI